MALSGRKKIIIGVTAALLVVIIVLVLALFIPRTGEKRMDVWGVDSEFSIENVQSLEAGDKQFKILMFTDLQLWSNLSDNNETYELMDELVERVQPDMIVLPGDNVSGLTTDILLKRLIKHMESYKIPWACTYGNHDAEGDADKDAIDEYLLSLEYCVYERGDPAITGHGNYYRNVTDASGKPIMTLFMMDSNMYDEANGGYDHFHEDQIEWYKNTVQSIAEETNGDASKVVPSLAFFHIPMQEFKTAYDAAKKDGGKLFGYRFEDECPPIQDDQMFETMVELGSTKGVFVGHDHMNNYEVEYSGIRLCYGLSCDHNIYLVPMRGGNLINIKADGSFTTQKLMCHRVIGTLTVTDEK